MNREILFRGKRVDNGEWAYGFYFEQGNGCDSVLSYISLGLLGSTHVDKNTVGQFTGLTDKNGKKIFEGDIVKEKSGNVGYVAFLIQAAGYVIVWKDMDTSMGHRARGSGYEHDDTLEVIGNIYDAEAALEKKEDSDA